MTGPLRIQIALTQATHRMQWIHSGPVSNYRKSIESCINAPQGVTSRSSSHLAGRELFLTLLSHGFAILLSGQAAYPSTTWGPEIHCDRTLYLAEGFPFGPFSCEWVNSILCELPLMVSCHTRVFFFPGEIYKSESTRILAFP